MGMKAKHAYIYFILPSLAGLLMFLCIPYLDACRRAFVESSSGGWAGLRNFREVIANPAFRLAMENTIRFDLICIPLLLVLTLMIAWFIFEQPGGAGFLKTGFLLPMAVPTASVVLMWRLLFDQHGILNGFRESNGLDAIPWMESNAAFWILIGCYMWKNLGYNIILWLAAFSTVPQNTLNAARLDGAGALARFRYVIFPRLTGAIFVILVLAVLNSFKVFREAYLVAGDYPHRSIYMIQNLFNNWFLTMEMDKLAAGSMIDSLVLIIMILILQKSWEVRG